MDISLLLLFLWLFGAEVENTAADKTFFQFPNPLNKFVVCRILLRNVSALMVFNTI